MRLNLKCLYALFVFLQWSCYSPSKKSATDACQEDSTTQIINGRVVLKDETLSKEAALLMIKRDHKMSVCTSVPISNRVLLTAAHCVMQTSPEMVYSVFSTENKCAHGFRREKQIATKSIVLHPDFDGRPQNRSDIALIYLSESIPTDYSAALLYDGKQPITDPRVEMLGYGITNELKSDSMILRTTTKDYFKDLAVKNSLVIFNQKNKTGGFCRGDSGGPVYIYTGNTKKIFGINSFNISATNQLNKECQTAGVAMYIPYFSNWIKNEILKM